VARLAGREAVRPAIKDVSYETRIPMGRDHPLRRFAEEVLGNSVDPVMLGYSEKGKRFCTARRWCLGWRRCG
jgi:hypothetical protein